jgi:negative regulator of replication initiation
MGRPTTKKDIRRFGTTLAGTAYEKLFRMAVSAGKSASDILEDMINQAEESKFSDSQRGPEKKKSGMKKIKKAVEQIGDCEDQIHCPPIIAGR